MRQCFIGVMSGSSLDGIDIALTEIDNPFSLEVLRFGHRAFDEKTREGLLDLTHRARLDLDQWLAANQQMGSIFGRAILDFLRKCGKKPDRIQAIGFHGVTIRHCPEPVESPVGPGRGTFQLGDPHAIRAATSIPVIFDFRHADMALGGQGAPLAPFLDHLLFGDARLGRILLNLGGIANLTLLPPGGEPVLAFDSGPSNMIVDGLMRRHPIRPSAYDPEGGNAARGKIVEPLLDACLRHPFFARNPPKSTGREDFGDVFLEKFWRYRESVPYDDLLATATRLTAVTVADAVRASVENTGGDYREIVASGGGVHNQTLMSALRELLPGFTITTTSDHGIEADAKEAVLMAALAWAHCRGVFGNFPAVTGARAKAVLGARTG